MRRKEDDSAEEREAQEAQKELEAAAARHKRRQDFAEQWELATSPSDDIANELRIQQVEKLRQGIVASDGEAVAERVTRALTNGFETTERRPDLRVSTNWDGTLTAAWFKRQLRISKSLADKVAKCAKKVSHDIPRSGADVDRERRRLLRELGKTIAKNEWLLFVEQLPDNAARNVLEGICEGSIKDDELDELLLKNRRTWSQLRSLKDSIVRLITVTEETSEPIIAGPTFLHAELAIKLEISESTLARWADKVEVKRPTTGQRDFRYSSSDAKKICEHGKTARNRESRVAAEALFETFNSQK